MTPFMKDFEETFGKLYSEEHMVRAKHQEDSATTLYVDQGSDFFVKEIRVDKRPDLDDPEFLTVITINPRR